MEFLRAEYNRQFAAQEAKIIYLGRFGANQGLFKPATLDENLFSPSLPPLDFSF